MNKEEFKNFITIDQKGHFPFQMIVEKPDNRLEMAALALNDVFLVYMQVLKYAMEPYKKIYFTMDLPSGRDIPTDFVAVHFKEADTDWELILIPYDAQGNRLPEVTGGEMFERLLKQCKASCKPLFTIREKSA